MLSSQNHSVPSNSRMNIEAGFSVRRFETADLPDVMRLYRHGLLGGHLDPTDRAVDMADIERTYFQRPQDHFWVAEANRNVIGSIAIAEDVQGTMHLRRLRVASSEQLKDRVAVELVRTAITHARKFGCVKLIFHTALDTQTATELLDGLGLQLSKVRLREGQHLIEFYPDLYAK